MKKVIFTVLIILGMQNFFIGDSSAQTGDINSTLLQTTYQWSDNGQVLGTIVFNPDGSANATWSSNIHYWKFDSNGDLIISAMGTTYITRLKRLPNSNNFSGERDKTSQVQDGV
ncbi:MAG: hypothetical protein HQK78_11730, partial [Desulfobacterales bacterium]|nr:hypothetical protein [Desulfobacterales bacterium]